MKYLRFALSHSIFIPLWAGLYLGGYYTYLNLCYVFVVLVLFDIIFGKEKQCLNKENLTSHESTMYKYMLYSWSFIHIYNVLFALYIVSKLQYTCIELLGLFLSLGIEGGQSIAVAHELCHKSKKFDKWLARVLLFLVLYNHFEIEHKYGHHINVATELDPATARYNQTFYNFWIQSVPGGIKSAYNLENKRCKHILQNKIVLFVLLYSLWLLILLLNTNIITIIFFCLQSFIGLSFLELSNYFEHYGLSRKKISENTYETVKFYHSWDNNNCISNWILFRLGRHSDHHMYPYKEYQYLIPYEKAPQLITGYPGSALLCLIPPLWFYIMNPKVDEIKKKYS